MKLVSWTVRLEFDEPCPYDDPAEFLKACQEGVGDKALTTLDGKVVGTTHVVWAEFDGDRAVLIHMAVGDLVDLTETR